MCHCMVFLLCEVHAGCHCMMFCLRWAQVSLHGVCFACVQELPPLQDTDQYWG